MFNRHVNPEPTVSTGVLHVTFLNVAIYLAVGDETVGAAQEPSCDDSSVSHQTTPVSKMGTTCPMAKMHREDSRGLLVQSVASLFLHEQFSAEFVVGLPVVGVLVLRLPVDEYVCSCTNRNYCDDRDYRDPYGEVRTAVWRTVETDIEH